MSQKFITARMVEDTTMIANLSNLSKAMAAAGGSSQFLSNIAELFEAASHCANYHVSVGHLAEGEWSNGTGYYDPIEFAVLQDEDGDPIVEGNSVAMFDVKTSRQIIAFVLEPGLNMVFHERYPRKGSAMGDVIVLTSGVPYIKQAIGIDEPWAGTCHHDLVMAARLFGFEYSRQKNQVYIPVAQRPENSMLTSYRVAMGIQSLKKNRAQYA